MFPFYHNFNSSGSSIPGTAIGHEVLGLHIFKAIKLCELANSIPHAYSCHFALKIEIIKNYLTPFYFVYKSQKQTY